MKKCKSCGHLWMPESYPVEECEKCGGSRIQEVDFSCKPGPEDEGFIEDTGKGNIQPMN